jgi:hypothetical protein
MKQTVFLFSAVLLLAACANAQARSDNTLLTLPAAPVAAVAAPAAPTDTNPISAAESAPASAEASAFSSPVGSDSRSSDNQEPPSVYGVFQNYSWQATAGYTFFRFYIVPHVDTNLNGLNLGLVYYPKGKWIGADGEFISGWGSSFGASAHYVQGMGGPRFRWSLPRGLEIWGHGLVGGAHFLPQTAFGSQSAFAYEVGGGVDLNVHHSRFAYRAGANMVGTRFFSTYQYSPNVSIGVVFKF